jgi:mannan endo-1,4-beta-mannosidase
MLILSSVATTFAAKSFSASNLYYAAGLTDSQQTTLLTGLQSAGVKVLRVWLDGMILAHWLVSYLSTHH